MTEQTHMSRFYPELAAGGFSRTDGTVEYYTRINALLRADMRVLDYGAGRGARLTDDEIDYRRHLSTLQGKVASVVAVDVDDAVLENPKVDERHVVGLGERLPFEDDSFDLIMADWVIEHIADPAFFEAEVYRLLKPGGWFCARTPNKWGITGLGARIIPNRMHTRVLGVLTPSRKDIDVFPVEYRLNTRGALRERFAPDRWRDASYLMNSEPPYVGRSSLLMSLVYLYWRLAPRALFTNLLVFTQKR